MNNNFKTKFYFTFEKRLADFLRYKRCTAFTLSEVLVVVAIIGVVAIMTIPTLMNRINNKDLATQLKESRSLISSAFTYARENNDGTLENVNMGALLGDYLKLKENCNLTNTTRCWHATGVAKMVQKDGSAVAWAGATTASAVAMNGMYIRIPNSAPSCSVPETTTSDGCYNVTYSSGFCNVFYVDINGQKGPNIYGQDIREVSYWADGYVSFAGSGRSRANWERLKDSGEYTEGSSCYDPNNYASSNFE